MAVGLQEQALAVVHVAGDAAGWSASQWESLTGDLHLMGLKFGVDVAEDSAEKGLAFRLCGPPAAMAAAEAELRMIWDFHSRQIAEAAGSEVPPETEPSGLAALGRVQSVELRAEVRLGDLPGEGRTLFAAEPIAAGCCICLERPALVAASRDALEERAAALLAEDAAALAPAVISQGEGDPQTLAARAVRGYCFDFLDGANLALFRLLGVVNHACAASEEANCCLSVPFDAGCVGEGEPVGLFAVRPIAAGEPLRMPYLCPFAPRRHLETLQEAHGFRCLCSSCRAGPPSLVARCCVACGSGGEGVALQRCSGCGVALYCGADCQRRHRRAHKAFCYLRDEETEAAFLDTAEREYDGVMSASDAALAAASEALRLRRRFEAEGQLDGSLEQARRFLDSRTLGPGRVGAAEAEGASRRLAASHPFAHYARGNLVKQALTRLAMRERLHGSEPPGGCGALAERARAQLEGCLAAASALPRFQVEATSLLQDAKDLGDLAASLCGLAADLEVCGEADEGRVSEEGLEGVRAWCEGVVEEYGDVTDAYGKIQG